MILQNIGCDRSQYIAQEEEAERAHQIQSVNQVLNYMGLPTTVSYGVPQTPGLIAAVVANISSITCYVFSLWRNGIRCSLNEHRRRRVKWQHNG